MTASTRNTISNMHALGKLAEVARTLTNSLNDGGKDPINIIRRVLADNNGRVSIAGLAGEINRTMGLPDGLDIQSSTMRTIISMANTSNDFFQVEGSEVIYRITSTSNRMLHTAAFFEQYMKNADSNKCVPHPVIAGFAADLKVFMRSNSHAIKYVTEHVIKNVPEKAAAVAYSIILAAFQPQPKDGSLPCWLERRAKAMIDIGEFDLVSRIIGSFVNNHAIQIDGFAISQKPLAADLALEPINAHLFYETLALLIGKVEALLTPKEAMQAPAMAPTQSAPEVKPAQSQELPIGVVEPLHVMTEEKQRIVRSELMAIYREVITDLNKYVVGYHSDNDRSAVENIRFICKEALDTDIGDISDDNLESFMLFGDPSALGETLIEALNTARLLQDATRLAYIFS